jgi:ABC-type transport system substrate-binding protein
MPPGDADQSAELLTFVIAEIRGYTTFTQQRGDEAAARLTFSYRSDSRTRFQAAFGGWVAGTPNDSDLIGPIFKCDQFVPASELNQNIDAFCDPSIDRLIGRAEAGENSASATAERLWAEVDAKLADAAPWIGLVTPSWVDAVSRRVHNDVRSAALGVFLDQMWVR